MRSVKSAAEDIFESKVVYTHYFSADPESAARGWNSSIVAMPPVGAGFHTTISASFNRSANEMVIESAIVRLVNLAVDELKVDALAFVGHRPVIVCKALRNEEAEFRTSATVLWDQEEHELFWNVEGKAVFSWDFGLNPESERLASRGVVVYDDVFPFLDRVRSYPQI
jgi:hypothetical protein